MAFSVGYFLLHNFLIDELLIFVDDDAVVVVVVDEDENKDDQIKLWLLM